MLHGLARDVQHPVRPLLTGLLSTLLTADERASSGWGYGLSYDYGVSLMTSVPGSLLTKPGTPSLFQLFKQLIDEQGRQLETPDPWLETQNAWALPRLDVTVPVRFYGETSRVEGRKGKAVWSGGQEVLAVAQYALSALDVHLRS